MKDIISAILDCALASGSDVNLIDSIKEDYRKAFIKGEFNKAILEDLENLNVKGLNNLLNDILEAEKTNQILNILTTLGCITV